MKIPGIRYVQGRNSYSDADGTKSGIAIHNTANDASAAGEAAYATRRTDGVSAHFYVDAREVIQSLDTKARAGHAGSSNGNQHAIAVEITGTNTRPRQWWLENVAWDQLGRVLAACCREYGISVRRASVAEMGRNPKVRAFYSHDDMRRAWGGTTHTDPGPNFPWDRLFEAVHAALDGEDDDVTPQDIQKIAEAVWAYRTKASETGIESSTQAYLRAADVFRKRELPRVELALAAIRAAVEDGADTDAIKAHIDQRAAELAATIDQVDEAVAERLTASTVEEQAALLRTILGDERARQVGALLAAS